MIFKEQLVGIRDFAVKMRNSIFGHKKYKKFIVITRSRTGSNLLISFLNSHPNIIAKGEVFRRIGDKPSIMVWNNFFSKKLKNVKYVGFKIFYYHPLDSQDKDVWNYIKNDKKIKLIHLTRENMLRTVVSREIADKTNTWTNKHGRKIETKDKRISLDVEKCFEEFETTKNHENGIRDKFKRTDFLELTYEDLVKNNQDSINKVFNFLQVENRLVKSSYKKQNKESLRELIINFDDLEKKLKKSKWSYLLDFDE